MRSNFTPRKHIVYTVYTVDTVHIPVLGEVTGTKLLRDITCYFLRNYNGFVTFKIAVTSNCKELLHLKLGNGFQVTRYIYSYKKLHRYLVTEKS